MSDQEFKKLFEIYEILSSGRTDMAKKMLEVFLDLRKPDPPSKNKPVEPEVA